MNLIPTLNAEDADLAVKAAVEAARAAGIAVTIAVVDAAGNLLNLRRMEGARGFSADLAARKARTSAVIGVPTSLLAQMYEDKPAPAELMAVGGGVPVISAGRAAGAIGVSGGLPDVDETIAQAGARVVPPSPVD